MYASNLVVIPVRKGSKRLPQKNVKLFFGRPLVYYTIFYAIKWTFGSRVVVCTDCEETASVAQQLGVEVLDRPASISGDLATTFSVILHVLHSYNTRGIFFKTITTLQATNPIRPAYLFEQCINTLNESPEATSVISVSKNDRKQGLLENGFFVPINYYPGQRSQDLKTNYFENGLMYITKSETLLVENSLFGDRVRASVVPESTPPFDIDILTDFQIAECYLKENIHLFKHLFE